MLARLVAALALMLALAPAQATPTLAASTKDWSRVVTRKPDGAFVEGNPEAKVKLVEYLSLTCPHCAHFEGEGIAPLTAKYIRSGLVSYEVRHALRDAFDVAASLLARCEGPAAFFTLAPVVYAQQQQWMEQAMKWGQTAPALDAMPPDKLLPLVAEGSGLRALFIAHGLAPAKADGCLTDPAERTVLTAMANEAWHRPDFPGTPTFVINGVQADGVATWADLDRKLAAALKRPS